MDADDAYERTSSPSQSHHWNACRVATLKQEYTRNISMVLTQPHMLIYVCIANTTSNANVTPKQEYGTTRSGGGPPRKRLPCSPTLTRNDHAKVCLY